MARDLDRRVTGSMQDGRKGNEFRFAWVENGSLRCFDLIVYPKFDRDFVHGGGAKIVTPSRMTSGRPSIAIGSSRRISVTAILGR